VGHDCRPESALGPGSRIDRFEPGGRLELETNKDDPLVGMPPSTLMHPSITERIIEPKIP
jgi:hypothetical protein